MPSPYQQELFWGTAIFLSVLSAAGSLAVAASVLLRYRHDHSSRFILYLSVADFGLSTVCLGLCAFNLAYGHLQTASDAACLIQPFATWYFMEVSILWLTVIAINSLKVVQTSAPITRRVEIAAHFVCWLLPVLTTALPIVPSVSESYGPRNGLWCSFGAARKGPQLANIMAYYGPCLLVIAACYGVICRRVYVRRRNIQDKLDRPLSRGVMPWRLFLFILAYLVVWTPLVVAYVVEAATGAYIPFAAEYIVDNLLHVQGLFNIALYGIPASALDRALRGLRLRAQSVSSGSLSRANSFTTKRSSVVELPSLPA